MQRPTNTLWVLFGTALLGLTLVAGCLYSPIPVRSEGMVIPEAVLKGLIGSSKWKVEDKLGPPSRELRDPDGLTSYDLYEGYWAYPLITERGGVSFQRVCTLLTFNADERLTEVSVRSPSQGAQCTHAFWTDTGEIEEATRNAEKAALVGRATQGDLEAAKALASEFSDRHYLRVMATSGHIEAATVLARRYEDVTALRSLASHGNAEAAMQIALLYWWRVDKLAEALKWLCQAANSGVPEAQAELGYWHRVHIWKALSYAKNLRKIGITPDNQLSYMWYTLAVSNGHQDSAIIRVLVEHEMGKKQIAQAEQMARDWKPGDCPSAEHRLQ